MNYFSSLIEAMLGMGAPPAVPAGDGMGGGFGGFFQPNQGNRDQELLRSIPAIPAGKSEQEIIDAYDLRNALLKHGYSTAPNLVRAIPRNPKDTIPVPQQKPQAHGDERDWLPGGVNFRPSARQIIPAQPYRPAPRKPAFIDA